MAANELTEMTPLDPLNLNAIEAGVVSEEDVRRALEAPKDTRTRAEALLEVVSTTLTISALLSRLLVQLKISLEAHDTEIPDDWQATLNWGCLILPFAVSLMLHPINNKLFENGADKYPAMQDYTKASLGSAFLYMIYDFLTKGEKLNQNLFDFVITTLGVPLLSFYFIRTTIPDTTRTVVRKIDYDSYAVREPRPGVRAYGAFIAALSYIFDGAIVFGEMQRQLAGKTVDASMNFMIPAMVYAFVVSASAVKLEPHNQQFDIISAVSKSCRDGALSYRAMSGLVSMLLLVSNTTEVNEDLHAALVAVCLIPTIAVAIHTYLHTHFRFDDQYQSAKETVDFADKVIKSGATLVRDAMGCCVGLFRKTQPAGNPDYGFQHDAAAGGTEVDHSAFNSMPPKKLQG